MDSAFMILAVIFTGIISIILVSAWHRQQIEKIRMGKQVQQSNVDLTPELRAELNALKEQLMALRDTTTKFDLSFDSALDSMEERVKRVEERQLAQNYQTSDEAQKLTLGR
jgi:hypothetical protein